jgi:putative two-component system response regulator
MHLALDEPPRTQLHGASPAGVGTDRILVVATTEEDVLRLTRLLAEWRCGHVDAGTEAGDVVGLCAEVQPDLVILDLDGSEPDVLPVLSLLRPWRAGRSPVPVLVLTGDRSVEATRELLTAGATDLMHKPFDTEEARLRIGRLLEGRRMQEDMRRHGELVEQRVRERTRELDLSRLELLQRLARAAEYRDDVSGSHPARVGRCVRQLSAELGYAEEMVTLLGHASVLHDIGNVAIPDTVLLKPGPLTPAEAATMRTHVEHGVELLAGSASPLLQTAQDIARSHHERWDGSGYPAGLHGQEIPIAGRITAVADVFDALMHDRPHRPAWSVASAVSKVAGLSGEAFDPDVVDAFLALDHEALLEPVAPRAGDLAQRDVAVLHHSGAVTSDPAEEQAPAPAPAPARPPIRTAGTADAAAAFGVSASTVRRWADSGHVPSERTAGGHRRFAVTEMRSVLGEAEADRPDVRRITPPSHALPAVAEILMADGPDLVRVTAGALYDGQPGWWTTGTALRVAESWIRSVAGCLLAGDYGPAIAATERLMDRAELAGTSRLERHRFLDRFSDILVRRVERDRSPSRTERLSLRRLLAALRQTLLEDEPTTCRPGGR